MSIFFIRLSFFGSNAINKENSRLHKKDKSPHTTSLYARTRKYGERFHANRVGLFDRRHHRHRRRSKESSRASVRAARVGASGKTVHGCARPHAQQANFGDDAGCAHGSRAANLAARRKYRGTLHGGYSDRELCDRSESKRLERAGVRHYSARHVAFATADQICGAYTRRERFSGNLLCKRGTGAACDKQRCGNIIKFRSREKRARKKFYKFENFEIFKKVGEKIPRIENYKKNTVLINIRVMHIKSVLSYTYTAPRSASTILNYVITTRTATVS